MNNQPLSIYIDLSLWIRTRINTGIQRVLKEYIQSTLDKQDKHIDYYYLNFDIKSQAMHQIAAHEISEFIKDVSTYQFTSSQEIELLSEQEQSIKVFFDMDATWNNSLKRHHLYPELKQNDFYIFNFLYDLSPVLLPQFCDENTCRNFVTYLSAVYSYSDMVFFDSASAEKGFQRIKSQLKLTRNIATRVTGLGADYMQSLAKINGSGDYQQLLQSKYLLFVGTIEPRKSQNIVLKAFDTLAKKYPDLNLIFIGKQGWKVSQLIQKIQSHPLIDKRLHWLNNIDDTTLSLFYQHAWLVIYLSKHEGYGLPIAESLRYNNLTVASKNSSMYEVGRNFADYVVYNSQNEIIDLISLYYDNPHLVRLKKQYIRENYQILKWDKVCQSISTVFKNFPDTLKKRQKHIQKLQFIFISINIDTLQGTLKAIERHISFVDEIFIVTSSECYPKAEKLKSQHPITIIDERLLLGDLYNEFIKGDHVTKNWFLRASILEIEDLKDEFIMLDDDNRPIKDIDIGYFINEDGRYNAYFFYDILNWNQRGSDYDQGQQNHKEILSQHGLELLCYSSHAPQIINKEIFTEAIELFYPIGLEKAIDEWSIYFNYAISKYPFLFNKKVFETFNWPARAADWQYQYIPETFSFENFYPSLYVENPSQLSEEKPFLNSHTLDEKIAIKQRQYAPYQTTQAIFEQYQHYLTHKNRFYGCLRFEQEQLNCYLFSVPKHIIAIGNAMFRLTMNVKVVNKSNTPHELQFYYLINGHMGHFSNWNVSDATYSETIIELPISTYGMRRRISQLKLDIKVDNKPLYGCASPYKIKLSQFKDTSKIKLPNTQNKLNQIEIESFELNKILKRIARSCFIVGDILRDGLKKLF